MTTRSSAGFTLVELMITLAVLALLIFVGLPGMSTWLARCWTGPSVRSTPTHVKEGHRLDPHVPGSHPPALHRQPRVVGDTAVVEESFPIDGLGASRA